MFNLFKYILFISLTVTSSCKGQDEVNIKLTIYNNSMKHLDSVLVHDVYDNETVYYDVKPDAIIVHNFAGSKSLIPKGERGVFTLAVFDKKKFYTMNAGFIGFPTSKLEDEYEFYIYDTFISTKREFIPKNKEQRQNIEEYIR